MEYYRGMSGAVSAIFVFATMSMAYRAFILKKRLTVALFALAGIGYIMKIIYESATGSTLFVESAGIFSPVPAAHLAGGVIGLVVFLAHTRYGTT